MLVSLCSRQGQGQPASGGHMSLNEGVGADALYGSCRDSWEPAAGDEGCPVTATRYSEVASGIKRVAAADSTSLGTGPSTGFAQPLDTLE